MEERREARGGRMGGAEGRGWEKVTPSGITYRPGQFILHGQELVGLSVRA
jgi:hypothetical protein